MGIKFTDHEHIFLEGCQITIIYISKILLNKLWIIEMAKYMLYSLPVVVVSNRDIVVVISIGETVAVAEVGIAPGDAALELTLISVELQ